MDVLFIASAVAARCALLSSLQAKVGVQISLDCREVISCNLVQICRVSVAMNECISAFVCLSVCL